MKYTITACAFVLAMAAGCAGNGKTEKVASTDSVLDIAPAPAPTPIYQPIPPAPTAYEPAAPAQSPVASTGGSYTVQRGDTLYGIARQKYGDGKQWQRIAAANPGVSPQSLKVGQTLVIP